MPDAAAMKQVVNMTLSTDTLRRARALIGPRNLSSTVDSLLADFVTRTEAERIRHQVQIARWVSASNAVITEHGSPAEEHDLF